MHLLSTHWETVLDVVLNQKPGYENSLSVNVRKRQIGSSPTGWTTIKQLKKVGNKKEQLNLQCSQRRADKRALDVLQCDVDGCGISPRSVC